MTELNKKLAFILSLLVFFSACKSHSQSSPINEAEVTWQPTLQAAITKAKEENKLLFVECYSPNCPYCMSIEPLWKDSSVAKAYNSNFVNYKINVEDKEQIKFINDLNLYLPSFPKFFFFDSDTNLVHQSSVVNTVEGLLTIQKEALDPKTQTKNYASWYNKGETDQNFLERYANHAIVIKDTSLIFEIGNKLFEAFPKDKLLSEESWTLTKTCIRDFDNGFSKFWFKNHKTARVYEEKGGHGASTVDNIFGAIIQNTLYSEKGKAMNSSKLDEVKSAMEQSGAGKFTDNVLWNFYAKAYAKEGKEMQALQIGQKLIDKYKTNPSTLVYLTGYFQGILPTTKEVSTKLNGWINNALPYLKKDEDFANIYLTKAKCQKAIGNIKQAKLDLEEANKFAVKAKLDLAKFTEFGKEL